MVKNLFLIRVAAILLVLVSTCFMGTSYALELDANDDNTLDSTYKIDGDNLTGALETFVETLQSVEGVAIVESGTPRAGVADTDYQSPLTAGTDYLAPDGDGSSLTGVQLPPSEGAFEDGDKTVIDALGTAANVDIESEVSATDTTNAATQAAIYAALQSGWTIDLGDLEEDTPTLVTHLTLVAAQAFTDNAILYMKSDGADGGRLYKYNADTAASDNDTYRFFCQATEASSGDGDSVVVKLLDGPCWIEQDDTYSFTYNQDEGLSTVVTEDGNGWEVLYSSAPSGAGDHVEFISIILQVQNAGAGTHDILLSRSSRDMNVIPTP
jgi:hypothetical protein